MTPPPRFPRAVRTDVEKRRAIAIWATCQFTGGALGPVLAGFLLRHFWWGSVFLVAVPAVALAAGAGLGSLFVRRQLRLESPLLDLRLFRNRPFTAVIVALVFAGIAMAGTGLLVTQYLQSVLGFSPVASAVLFAPMGLGTAAGTMAAPALARRMRQPAAIAGGLVVSSLGSLLLVGVGTVASALPQVMIGITVLALGTGPLFALGTGLGAELLHAAREAFTAGLHVNGAVAAVIFAGLAVLIWTMRPATLAGAASHADREAARLPS
ncbi:MFS transporter [Nonomuraea gerenzanensis]|uniref:Major facilitator superfamily MFS_1 n=1 Tax=Nonomuraea gerenzanensis TaxID=93944 RepID=A0A1M4E535_9ACTN|nr:MFS transporter [Nonomuraea gerenzanensis]UBU16075.1 MFS transporter [Nonomuraea gerenzanensis]SBO93878.1 major facilitator superfamily MFS_1 [Nonomuraea gerenzanensis]